MVDKIFQEKPKKFWDTQLNQFKVFVTAGTHYVTKKSDEILTTTLGSCISVCIRDRQLGIGGMNHFMLPKSKSGDWGGVSASMRYGNHAMEVLINDIFRMGGARNRLEIKVFGGADLQGKSLLVGSKNVEFIETFLRVEHMAIDAQHLGGDRGRKLLYFPTTGKAKMKLLETEEELAKIQEEIQFKSILEREEVEGSVELF